MRRRVAVSPSVKRSQGHQAMKNNARPSQGFAAGPTPLLSACDKFFGTIELLEEAILHLPLRNIIEVQRINKTFNTTIQCSKKIQRVIFFAPIPGCSRLGTWHGTSVGTEQHKHSMILNMVLEATAGHIRSTRRLALFETLNDGRSWKYSMVSTPPCTHVRYVGAASGELHTVSNTKGVTVGNAFDAAKQNMPVNDRRRTLGPLVDPEYRRELPKEITGWEAMFFFQEILDGKF